MLQAMSASRQSGAVRLAMLGLAVSSTACGSHSTPTRPALTATLGEEENVIPPSSPGLLFVPDEHLTYQRQPDGTFKLWMSGGGTLGFTTPDLLTLTPMKASNGVPTNVLAPAGPGTAAFDADYAGAGNVLPASSGAELLMIYHAENHLFGSAHYPGTPFYASIGLARSSDGGLTWQREGQILSGRDPQQASQPPTGAGALTPTVIASGGYLYAMFREIDLQSQVQGFALARAPIESDAAAGSWQKLFQGNFSTPGLGGDFTPLTLVLDPGAENDRRQPCVSYNLYLQAFLLAVVGNGGVYVATSADLVTWSTGQVILPAPVPDVTVTPTTAPYHWYPTLISPDQPSEATTSRSGFLYYAKGANDGTPHHTLYRRSFSLTKSP
jgi:hypothetical protein